MIGELRASSDVVSPHHRGYAPHLLDDKSLVKRRHRNTRVSLQNIVDKSVAA